MRRNRISATLLLTLTLAAGAASTVNAQDAPITLRFAISDGESAPTEPLVRAFVEEVATRSGGSVTLAPVFNAAADTGLTFEEGTAKLLVDGQADLAMVAARGWGSTDVTSLQALQAPFLITDEALALAVAQSSFANDMLGGMADAGVTGLTMWPEDLCHPFAFENCVNPFVSPDQLAGLTIRSVPNAVTWDLMKELGATPVFYDDYGDEVDSCDLDAAESGFLQGANLQAESAATGDVTFYTKFQVLAANNIALEKLSTAQQAAIRDAAEAVQAEAIATRPTEGEAAAAWCANSGRVVLAGVDGIAAFQAAAQPVFDRIAEDPVTAAAIEAIRALAETVEPAAGAEACEPVPAPTLAPKTSGEAASMLPDGTWRVVLTREDMLTAGAQSRDAPAGVYTWTFGGGEGHHEAALSGGVVESCDADLEVSGDVVLIVYRSGGDCDNEIDSVRWQLDDEGLHLSLVDIQNAPIGYNRAYLEAKPWQRIE